MGVDPGTAAALAAVAGIAGTDLANKIYDDMLSGPAKQFGESATDVAKTARLLLTAPLQLMAVGQDRLAQFCNEIRQKVPEDRRTFAPPEIAGPAFEHLKYVADDNPIKEMWLNLLARSIDKERQSEAHPAFIEVIKQLSRDEALLLARCSKSNGIPVTQELATVNGWIVTLGSTESNTDADAALVSKLVRSMELAYPDRLRMYVDHLLRLNIVEMKTISYTNDSKHTGHYMMQFTEWGRLFRDCCLK